MGRPNPRPPGIADATDFHITHRQLIAATQLSEFLDRPESLTCRITKAGFSWIEQPCMGLNTAAADTTPKLVELGQTKSLRILNQDRVDPGDI